MTKQTDKKTAKNKVGRPSTFKKKYSKEIIEHCSKNAQSFASWCAANRIPRTTFNRWRDEIPDFRDACEIGAQLGQEFLEKLALSSAAGTKDGQKMNAGMIQFMLRSRYPDYRQEKFVETKSDIKSEIELKADAKISNLDDKEMEEEIERRLKRIQLRNERKKKKT